MTTAVQSGARVYSLTGTQTGPFATEWTYESAAEVAVYLEADGVPELLASDTDYTLAGATPLVSGGSVTLNSGVVPEGEWDGGDVVYRLVLRRQTTLSQPQPFGTVTVYQPGATEKAADKLTRQMQDQAVDIARAPKAPYGEDGPAMSPAAQRAGKIGVFSPDGTLLLGGQDREELDAAIVRALEAADAAPVATAAAAQAVAAAAQVQSALEGVAVADGTGFSYTATGGEGTLTMPSAAVFAWHVEFHRNGVPQTPGADYTVSGTTLTLIPAAVAGETFWGVKTGSSVSYAGEQGVVLSGMEFDPTSDNTVQVQALFDQAADAGLAIIWPDFVKPVRVTAPLTLYKPLTIIGHGAHPRSAANVRPGPGAWLFFDHADEGLLIGDGVHYFEGCKIEGLGLCRNQPTPSATPGTAWAPNNFKHDIYVNRVGGVVLEDLVLLNPTRGVGVYNACNRVSVYNLVGQAFKTLIDVDYAVDVVNLVDVRQWPIFADNVNCHDYTVANLDALYFKRNDNPLLTGIFTIFARSGLRFGQNANGRTSKLKGANLDFDRGSRGVWIDDTVTDGVTAHFVNLSAQAETDLAGSQNILDEGTGSAVSIANLRTDLADDGAVRIAGTNNRWTFSGDISLYNFDEDYDDSDPVTAVVVEASNAVFLTGRPLPGGPAVTMGGAGYISAHEWRAWAAALGATSVAQPTVTRNSAHFMIVNDKVSVKGDFTISNNNGASAALKLPLPYGTSARRASGTGVIVGTKRLLAVHVDPGAAFATTTLYDGTYPGGSGVQIEVDFTYDIAVP